VATAGAVISVHNKNIRPLLIEEGFKLDTNQQTNLVVSRNYLKKLSYPYSNCIDDKHTIDSFHSASYKYTIAYLKHYRQRFCLIACLQEFLMRNCNCIDLKLPVFEMRNVSPCLTDEQQNCMSIQSTKNAQLNEFCLSECPLRCNSLSYNLVPFHANYPNDNYARLIMNSLNFTKLFNTSLVTLSQFRRSCLAVSVYFDSMTYTKVVEQPELSFVELLANVGGLAGLFLGISLLSFVELIEIFAELSIYFFKKRSKTIIQVQERPTVMDNHQKFKI
jgi:hypothetical protein